MHSGNISNGALCLLRHHLFHCIKKRHQGQNEAIFKQSLILPLQQQSADALPLCKLFTLGFAHFFQHMFKPRDFSPCPLTSTALPWTTDVHGFPSLLDRCLVAGTSWAEQGILPVPALSSPGLSAQGMLQSLWVRCRAFPEIPWRARTSSGDVLFSNHAQGYSLSVPGGH